MKIKYLLVACILLVFSFGCVNYKKPQAHKAGCDTCPSLSNEGKIDKPHASKKKRK
ncbi:MAG: hypothetical protein K2Q22_11755 [Cytophagales bacterium]|nr:hypothetical protein [Cytophagales bacterium]